MLIQIKDQIALGFIFAEPLSKMSFVLHQTLGLPSFQLSPESSSGCHLGSCKGVWM
jgi:hypothetical protein